MLNHSNSPVLWTWNTKFNYWIVDKLKSQSKEWGDMKAEEESIIWMVLVSGCVVTIDLLSYPHLSLLRFHSSSSPTPLASFRILFFCLPFFLLPLFSAESPSLSVFPLSWLCLLYILSSFSYFVCLMFLSYPFYYPLCFVFPALF